MKYRSFTLVELVIAMGLLSIIAVLGVSILVAVQRLWEDLDTHTAQLEALQNIDRIADCPFKNMIPFSWPNLENKDQEIFRGDPDRIIFAYLHRSAGGNASGIRFIELKLEDKQLIARYRKTPMLYWLGEPQDDETTLREVLADNIENLEFEYAEREGDDILWYADWDEENAGQIPLAVCMRVRFVDGTEDLWLRRAAGCSFETAFGKRIEKRP